MKLALVIMLFFSAAAAAFAQATLNLSQDLVRLGIASSNMTPNQQNQDAGPLMTKGVEYAQNHQIGRVIADRGSYYFLTLAGSVHHVSLQVHNMTIDFQGSDLYLAHRLYSGLGFYVSTNLVLENFTIDYMSLPFTQLRVVSVDAANRRIQYTVPPGWSDPSAFNSLQNTAGWDGTIEVHMFRNGQPAPDTIRMAARLPFAGDQFTLVSYQIFVPSDVNLAKIRPGDIAVLAMRKPSSPVVVSLCSGCTIRNVVAYSSAGDGVNVIYSQSTVVERVHTIPRPGTDRLISTYGQGFTPSGPNNVVRLSRAIRTMDDGFSFDLWVTGTVQNKVNSRSLSVEGTLGTTLSQNVSVTNGSPVTFQRPSDGAILTSAVVVSQNAPAQFSEPYRVVFNFDRDLPDNLVGSDMYTTDPGQRGANTLMERNAVEEETDCCRGISIWGFVNSTLFGNYVRRSAMTGVNVTHHLNLGDWQVPPVVNLSISNNVIDTANAIVTNYGDLQLGGIDILAHQSDFQPMATSPNQNITVTGNFIADPGTSAVWMGNTTGGSVSGNYFLNPNNNPALRANYQPFNTLITQPLVVDRSQDIITSSNTIDKTSGRVWVTDNQFRELAAYAPGSTIRLNAYNIGTFSGPAITLTDADGKTAPATIQRATAHAIDVQIPPAAGLGGAYLTLISGEGKSFGTLFLDSVDNIPAVNGCTYEFSPPVPSVSGSANVVPILVVTQSGCPYQAVATDLFVSANASGAGTGIIKVKLEENRGASRNTTIEIAGQPITLTQSCVYAVSPGDQAFTVAGGAGSVSVTAPEGCSWSISDAPSWIEFSGNLSGTGNGSVNYQVAANNGTSRAVSMTIGGLRVTIEQQAASIPGLNFIGSMPHIAAQESWTTAFTLVNKGTTTGRARLSLFGDASGPLLLPLAFPQQSSTTGSLLAASLDRTISANASLIINTEGPQVPPVQTGSAQLAATGAVDGFAIFHQIPTAQEAVVPLETRNASSYLLAFDNTGGVVLGVALGNVSAQAASIPVVIRDDAGVQIGTPGAMLDVAGSGHTSFVLSTQFPATANKRGTIEFYTPPGGRIGVLGIRFTPPNNALTTIPALANVGTNGGSIAHIATGSGWQTTFILVNAGNSTASVHLKFFADVTGAPLSIPFSFPQSSSGTITVASSLDQTLAAGASLLIQSAAPLSNPTPTIGSAQLTTDGRISGFVIFRYNPNGQEAVAPLESRNANAYILAFDNTNGTATGVAINSVSSQTVSVAVVIRDDFGNQIGNDTLSLAANGHLAFTLVTDKYPLTANIRGTLEFNTPPSGQIGVLGIRVPPALTFTTLPALVK